MNGILLLLSTTLAATGDVPPLPAESLLSQVQVGAQDERVSKVPS